MILVDLARCFALTSRLKLAQGMQYRVDFLMGLVVSLASSALAPLATYLVIRHTRGYPRWNLEQLMLFQGMVLLWVGIRDLLFGEVRGYVEEMVRGGSFDRLLLKPYPAIGSILISGFYYPAAGTIVAGLVVLAAPYPSLRGTVHAQHVLLAAAFLVCGILLHLAITVLYCTVVILVTYMGRLGEILDKLLVFFQYPVDVLSPGVRLALCAFLPIAVWAYFPAEALLGRLTPVAFVGMGTCLLLFLASLLVWRHGVERYTSAGG